MLTFMVIIYRLWLCAKDCICAGRIWKMLYLECWVEIYYIILSSLHPQYGGQKAIDMHRYKLLQLVLSGDATPLYLQPSGYNYMHMTDGRTDRHWPTAKAALVHSIK